MTSPPRSHTEVYFAEKQGVPIKGNCDLDQGMRIADITCYIFLNPAKIISLPYFIQKEFRLPLRSSSERKDGD